MDLLSKTRCIFWEITNQFWLVLDNTVNINHIDISPLANSKRASIRKSQNARLCTFGDSHHFFCLGESTGDAASIRDVST